MALFGTRGRHIGVTAVARDRCPLVVHQLEPANLAGGPYVRK